MRSLQQALIHKVIYKPVLLWQSQRTAAWQLLAEVYGWFTKGFETADLTEAKAPLDALCPLT